MSSAAVGGVLVASLGIAASHATGVMLYDAVAGVAIGAGMMGVGLALARAMNRSLAGVAPPPEDLAQLRRVLEARPAIAGAI